MLYFDAMIRDYIGIRKNAAITGITPKFFEVYDGYKYFTQ
jgi:hypothetical protein